MPTNLTHDPSLHCWVESANVPGCDFPIQNLPFCVFSEFDSEAVPRGGIAIGDQILDLAVCADESLFGGRAADAVFVAAQSTLNELMTVDSEHMSALRAEVSALLSGNGHTHRGIRLPENLLYPMDGAVLYMPVRVGNYTDFYASIYHATNVGSMFRPDNPLLPNYKWVPIGYHGRASSISLKETVVRPHGQTKPASETVPSFGPCQQLDYEMEVGAFIARGNALGDRIPISDASETLFGFCLVNDWSARDIQSWEYQPLGPFLSKSFATNISPFIVTREALEPFRVPAFSRPSGDPAPLDYLNDETDQAEGGYDIQLEVYLATQQMRDAEMAPVRLSHGTFSDMYWTMAQMVAHHTSNGCDLRPGDLIASGTVSGQGKDERGCLLEITRRGAEPIALPTGEQRQFLEDGDEVIMRGYCEREGSVRIGFGECRAMIVAEEELMPVRKKTVRRKPAAEVVRVPTAKIANMNSRFFDVRQSGIQGKGAFATKKIRKGQRIIEYTGELISNDEADSRYDETGMKRHHTFLFTLTPRKVVDGAVNGNESIYINHSCDPNCEAVIEDGRIFIEAVRTIAPGEELAYDYQYERTGENDEELEKFYKCLCGAPNCRGSILKAPAPRRKKTGKKAAKRAAKR